MKRIIIVGGENVLAEHKEAIKRLCESYKVLIVSELPELKVHELPPVGEFKPLGGISRTETIDSDLIRDQNGRRKKPLFNYKIKKP